MRIGAYRLLDVVHGHARGEVSAALRRRGDRDLEARLVSGTFKRLLEERGGVPLQCSQRGRPGSGQG